MEYLKKHILVCSGHDSCDMEGGAEVREALKAELKKRGLRKLFRDGECTCMGLCGEGVNVVIWPEGTYLGGVTEDDIPRLVDFIEGKGPRLDDREACAREKIVEKLKSL